MVDRINVKEFERQGDCEEVGADRKSITEEMKLETLS